MTKCFQLNSRKYVSETLEMTAVNITLRQNVFNSELRIRGARGTIDPNLLVFTNSHEHFSDTQE